MEYRTLGRTGLKVSRLCLGTMQWGWTVDEPTAFAIMDAFVERGGNFFDTADFYARWIPGKRGGESEEIIGRWLHARGNRSQVVIATKVYHPMGEGPNERGLSRKHIIEAVEASLRRLQTDYLDLYLAHVFDAETPIEETLRAFDDLQRSGKVRYIGASNYPAWRLVEALWCARYEHTARYEVLEPHYNLVHRAEFEQELQTICQQYGLGVIPYSPLAGGFLGGSYRRGEGRQSARAAAVLGRYDQEQAWRTLEAVQAIAGETQTTPAAVALAWLLAQPAVTAPIIGASQPAHLEDGFAALALQLTPEQLARLSTVSQGL
ncbi:MAG: aldo/keto reductase [Thermogemmatispora sp.]|uniref:aldo/keto reductase n=1 Tax=Thermogemmatispora sp. TaxID=1968838 RepID=UPI00262B5DF0|nr:aldo/keto reductase [Thermogemmatispora sp.]MBX5459088.1 aldo/keto reductase [Thermogemmatispora sp.]